MRFGHLSSGLKQRFGEIDCVRRDRQVREMRENIGRDAEAMDLVKVIPLEQGDEVSYIGQSHLTGVVQGEVLAPGRPRAEDRRAQRTKAIVDAAEAQGELRQLLHAGRTRNALICSIKMHTKE